MFQVKRQYREKKIKGVSYFSILRIWIRIHTLDVDPDLESKMSTDPDPSIKNK